VREPSPKGAIGPFYDSMSIVTDVLGI